LACLLAGLILTQLLDQFLGGRSGTQTATTYSFWTTTDNLSGTGSTVMGHEVKRNVYTAPDYDSQSTNYVLPWHPIDVVCMRTDENGNIWYKLADGNWLLNQPGVVDIELVNEIHNVNPCPD
jgi:hypothetical protein